MLDAQWLRQCGANLLGDLKREERELSRTVNDLEIAVRRVGQVG
jgi:hypothetical protein